MRFRLGGKATFLQPPSPLPVYFSCSRIKMKDPTIVANPLIHLSSSPKLPRARELFYLWQNKKLLLRSWWLAAWTRLAHYCRLCSCLTLCPEGTIPVSFHNFHPEFIPHWRYVRDLFLPRNVQDVQFSNLGEYFPLTKGQRHSCAHGTRRSAAGQLLERSRSIYLDSKTPNDCTNSPITNFSRQKEQAIVLDPMMYISGLEDHTIKEMLPMRSSLFEILVNLSSELCFNSKGLISCNIC